MKTLLKQSMILLGLATCVLANLSQPASADSTAALIISLRCQSDYNINVWRRYISGELLYRGTGPLGHLDLGKGSRENTVSAQVYKFKRGDYVYQVVSGRGDHRWQGALEVFKNGRSILNQTCKQEA
jgi:hypothetical protein